MTDESPRQLGASKRIRFNHWDQIASILVIGLLVVVAHGARQTLVPLTETEQTGIGLDLTVLPGYALRTTLRMFVAITISLVFTLIYATLAAKSRRAELVLMPMLDILQSVPILG